MTGYAQSSQETAAGTLVVELRSVNSRFLDLQFRINDELRAQEPALREAITAKVARGKVECRVSLGRKSAEGYEAGNLNTPLLQSLVKLQDQVRTHFPQAAPFSINELLRWPGMIAEAGAETVQSEVLALARQTLGAFLEARAREGAALATMLLTRVDEMQAIVERITPLIPQQVQQFQQKATERMQEALGLALADGQPSSASLSQQEAMERIRQEVTLYGIRIDVAEELTRLQTHLEEVRHILKKGGQVGKRLDFMMQELNREANTIGSKASAKEISDASMALKLLIEQMREQVQNLE